MNPLIKCFALLLCQTALLLAAIPSASAAKPDAGAIDLIHDAWREYQYREFDTAQSIFYDAFKKATVKEDKLQALTGQAFCLQFGKRALATSSDYEGAITFYRKALEIAGHDAKFEPFFNAMIAECSYRIYSIGGDEAKLKEAEAIWADLNAKSPNSLVAQDALIFKTFATTKSFRDDNNLENIKQVSAHMAAVAAQPDADGAALTPVMANYLSTVCFWRGDYKGSVHWLQEYLKLGPTCYTAKTNAVFKIARISDLKLQDAKTSCEYYSLFAKSFPVDKRRYFSEQKAASFAKEAGH